jgi:DHA1 family tetracycline resistance protein-like MFS transporter
LVGAVAFTYSSVLLYAGIVIYTLGDGLFEPAMTGLISNAADQGAQGRVQGANQSIQSVARVVAPLSAGALYEIGASLPYFAAAILMAATLAGLFYFSRKLVFAKN